MHVDRTQGTQWAASLSAMKNAERDLHNAVSKAKDVASS